MNMVFPFFKLYMNMVFPFFKLFNANTVQEPIIKYFDYPITFLIIFPRLHHCCRSPFWWRKFGDTISAYFSTIYMNMAFPFFKVNTVSLSHIQGIRFCSTKFSISWEDPWKRRNYKFYGLEEDMIKYCF